jgi:subtilisin family serine protease
MSRILNRLTALLAVFAMCVPSFPATPAAAYQLPEAPAVVSLAPPAPRQASSPVDRGDGMRYVAGELIVRFVPEVGRALALRGRSGMFTETGLPSLDRLGTDHGLQAIEPIFRRHTQAAAQAALAGQPPAPSLGDAFLLRFPAQADVQSLATAYNADPAVVYAEPNYVFEFDGQPDDPSFGQQWYLHNTGQYYLADADVDAPEAWDIVTGTATTVIAVIDTGVDRDHPDLDEHIWTNPGETPGNSVDDDGNGYVDDIWGWNWVSDLSDPDDYDFDDPRDDNGHGTHVAGIAAADTDNGIGVAGMCWNCRIMALKAFEFNGVGTTSDIVQAIDYAAEKGADVINMSFGSYAESLLLEDTLADAYGQAVLVAAAGNYGKTPWATKPYYPASYSYVLGVGATDVGCVQRDPITLACLLIAEHRADFSNYGINADVGAPGVSIYSTFRGSTYASLSGTSMAAPIVSGLAALLLSHNLTWPKEMVRGQIIKTAEAIYSGEFGRVNAYSALTVVPTPDLSLVADSQVYDDSSGNGDGIPDAGETFNLTLALKNYWGEATGTSAVLSTSDPYVTLLDDTASFGDISAYATMRNSASPFEMTLDSSAPNNHQVDFSLDVTANGGAYGYSAGFSFLVQRGIEIPDPLFPAVITQSMTLHSDYLYIVKQNMLVQQGVTLTIEPGTRLQFDPDKFIKIQGTLIASGTEELPITFTSNRKDPQPRDFKGIIFDDQATDAVLDSVPVTTTIAAEGDTIPEIGAVVAISGTPRFDSLGDVYFSAIISGAPDFEQVLHWYNGVGLVEASGDPLPGGSASTPFSETVSLVDSGSGKRVVFGQPSGNYVSGSILNHVILEYGGGLLIDDSFPYVANSTFRYCYGAIPAGTIWPHGVVTVDRQTLVDGGLLVLRGNTIRDTPLALWVLGYGSGQVRFADNVVWNNDGHDAAGLHLQGGPMVLQIRDNLIQYNRADNYGAGLHAEGVNARFEGNVLSRNESRRDGSRGGGGRISSGSVLMRLNVISGKADRVGHEPGNGNDEFGGSALSVEAATPTIQFNTIVGNQARPGGSPRTEPGQTLLLHAASAQFTRNNILGNQASFDLYLSNNNNNRRDVDATQNYWGTTNANEIRYDRIYDYWQDFEPGEATFQPFLTRPEPLAPGFLWQATTQPPDPIGAEVMTVTLDFSRDMNTAITPTVTFGVDEPYTQNAIDNGAWVSPTRWIGTYEVTVDTGDGINTFQVSDAEDTDGMTIPEDTRFQFVIQTAGTSAVLLEAVAGVGQVALTWTQNDVTDLAGYILYRSAYTNTDYSQIGGGMFVTTAYSDTDVTNGVPYYYKYSVLDTDFNEVAWSNEVSVTPDDYTLPNTPTVTDDGAMTHYFDRLHATWASADPETGIAEYHYCIGTAAGSCDTVSWTSMGTLTETTKTGLNLVGGETYYVNVKARNSADHWSAVGTSDGIAVDKLPPPAITAVDPISGGRTADVALTITGSGFTTSTARLGSYNLADLAVVSPVVMTATIPAYSLFAGVYTLTVTNSDTQAASLARAYTATNPVQGPRPLLFAPSSQQVGDDETGFTVDVQVQDVSDLAAFEFDVTYDPVVVHVVDVTLGAFLGSGGLNTVALGPDIDNGTGRVTFGGIGYGSGSGANGSGTLATLTFSPQAAGTTGLAFENEQLRDSLNSEIPAGTQPGQVQIVHYPFGDFDRDCDVDVADIMVVASRWNSHSGEPGYDPAYDFDADGDIDVADIMQVAIAWGDTCGGLFLGGTQRETNWATDQAAMVTVLPAIRDVDTGATYTTSITVGDALDLGGFQFDLSFDPGLLQVDDVTLGGFLGSTGRNVGELGPDINNGAGSVTYGAFSFGSPTGPSGGGLLAVVTYTTFLTPGVTSLDLLNVQLIDTNAWTQPAQAVSGSLTLLGGPRVGSPAFSTSVPSDEPLTVTVGITNTTSTSGVVAAALHYGYTPPYSQSSVAGSGPGGNGDGLWTFAVLPQGDGHEGQTLRFWLSALDGDASSGETVDDNGGVYYTSAIADDDTEPPIFSNPAPAQVFYVYSITLQVDIADVGSGIADDDLPDQSVYVAWDTDGELAVDAFQGDMDWLAGSTYALDTPIGPLASGLTVTWQVYAEDDDNSPAGGWSPLYATLITDTIFGDLDYDCDVDLNDIMIVVAHWNTHTGQPGYDARYDFDHDGDIDVMDVMRVAAAWGDICSAHVEMPASPEFVEAGADLFFEPSALLVQSGEPFTMSVAISGADDLAGFEFDLLFDPAAITVTGVHLGNFLGSSGNTLVVLGPRAGEAGRLVYGAFSYGEQPGASGNGSLVVLDLTLLTPGETALNLKDVQLARSNAAPMPLHAVGQGQIRTSVYIYLPLVWRSY